MAPAAKSIDTIEKLKILSNDSKYDLACSCATREDEHRKRSGEDKWIYPVTFENGGWTFLFKTLLSNKCVNNCKYCPLRAGEDPRRCDLSPEELAKTFLSYYRARKVSGLFLTSGVGDNPDGTMFRINRTALILRKSGFRGYIHLKVIPGSSDAAIKHSLSLATAVSINIETANEKHFKQLSTTKNYLNDIVRPIRFISKLTSKGAPFQGVKQTTQFVVGAGDETDEEIVRTTGKLYGKMGLKRVYFSAYQRGAGSPDLPGERSEQTNKNLLSREHRLYQVDWLLRKYGFGAEEIPFEKDGKLSLDADPKEVWAKTHPEFFPLNINKAEKAQLLRVPGLGHIAVNRILEARKRGARIRAIEDIGKETRTLKKAAAYVKF